MARSLKTAPATKNPMPTARTSVGLRDALFDELDRLREGRSDPKQANAVARISGEIVRSALMDLKVHQMMRKETNGTATFPTLVRLGSESE